MSDDIIYAIAAVLAIIFGGIIILVPVLALTLRYALRPVIESWARIRKSPDSEQEHALLTRRIELLESELQHMQHTVRSVTEAQEFQRQLSDGPLSG